MATLTTQGTTVLGVTSSDILTVNATTTFQSSVINDSTVTNNDTVTNIGTLYSLGNVFLGNNAADTLTVAATTDFMSGLTTSTSAGYRYSTISNASGPTPQTANGYYGTVSFTNIPNVAPNADLATPVVINNSVITGSSRGCVYICDQTVAVNACFVVKNISFTGSTMTIKLHNAGNSFSGSPGIVTICFIIFS